MRYHHEWVSIAQYNLVSSLLEQIEDALETINDLNVWAKWGIGLGLTLIALGLARLVLKKVVLDVVKQTQFEWDDKLFAPVSKRVYFFVSVAGFHLSMNWIMGEDSDFAFKFIPLIQSIYIILSASLLSVGIKVMIPELMDRFSDPSSVTVSGSNSLVIFLLRAAIWGGGLYLAFSELGIELFGLLASLAVFSLIIGLAVKPLKHRQLIHASTRPAVRSWRQNRGRRFRWIVASVGILSAKILTHEENLVVIQTTAW